MSIGTLKRHEFGASLAAAFARFATLGHTDTLSSLPGRGISESISGPTFDDAGFPWHFLGSRECQQVQQE